MKLAWKFNHLIVEREQRMYYKSSYDIVYIFTFFKARKAREESKFVGLNWINLIVISSRFCSRKVNNPKINGLPL